MITHDGKVGKGRNEEEEKKPGTCWDSNSQDLMMRSQVLYYLWATNVAQHRILVMYW